ncbi:hypothetical protein BHE74_00047160 [Ensete ventricosum]|nr:hypothetical protein GW17_00047238 [Ensete ventricosum]RWW46889.1 hypothetical protein BHE74_00047160 [Ensete ventricosum]RZR97178.1 hypothetical protein BHM03_00026311 [Ensete ventricosum]
MDRGSAAQNSRVAEVFRDIKGRRAGILKALTTDFEEFYQQCDPGKLFYHYYHLQLKFFRVSLWGWDERNAIPCMVVVLECVRHDHPGALPGFGV